MAKLLLPVAGPFSIQTLLIFESWYSTIKDYPSLENRGVGRWKVTNCFLTTKKYKIKTRPDFKLKKLNSCFLDNSLLTLDTKKSTDKYQQVPDIQITKNVKLSFPALLLKAPLNVSLHLHSSCSVITKGKLHCVSIATECAWKPSEIKFLQEKGKIALCHYFNRQKLCKAQLFTLMKALLAWSVVKTHPHTTLPHD